SDVLGNSGAMCSLALNMWPSAKEISDVNIYEPHEYEVRIRWWVRRNGLGLFQWMGQRNVKWRFLPLVRSRSKSGAMDISLKPLHGGNWASRKWVSRLETSGLPLITLMSLRSSRNVQY
ncbi:MAG TPA: hypothetical protein V6D48_16570, partial [Oculatellaceae cyanobacterium]